MKKILALLLLLTSCTDCDQYSTNLSWIPPSQREDETFLPLSEINYYVISVSTEDSIKFKFLKTVPGELTETMLTGVDFIDELGGSCDQTFTVSMHVVDNFGIRSEWSNVVDKRLVFKVGGDLREF